MHGAKAAIRIARDADGVPTIIAADDDDAAFGLGFVHAQDRLFQMELMRRYAAGRLAEIFGPKAVPVDKEMRVLGLYRAAEAEIPFSVARGQPRVPGLCRRGQRLSRLPSWRAAARVPAAAFRARAVARGRQPRLGQADGAADRGQLSRRIAARAHGADDLAGGHGLSLSRISRRMRRPPWRRCCRSIAASGSVGSTTRCRGRSGRFMPRTIGWSTASTAQSGKPLLANDPHLRLRRAGPLVSRPLEDAGTAKSPAPPRPAFRSS